MPAFSRFLFHRRSPLALALLLSAAGSARAEVTLPPIIGDNMVLQRETRTNLWGHADPGETVTVKIDSQSVSDTAGPDGAWAVKLDGLRAGGPYELNISGKNQITVQNVAVGEVWLCAGASNMAMPVSAARDATSEIAKADYPMLRYFAVQPGGKPGADAEGHWVACAPDEVKRFSAAAYYFGRDLNQSLHMPVGLIVPAEPASTVQAWAPGSAEATGTNLGANEPGSLYRARIAPLTRYAIRGATFYQGEADVSHPADYAALFENLIGGWRAAWKEGDFPFLYVQLAGFLKPRASPGASSWAELREAQAEALSARNTAMVVAIDTGAGIHPADKQAVGHRLALQAEALAYGKRGDASGPVFAGMKVQAGKAILSFQHASEGLVKSGDGPLRGFAIAGENRIFVWADATIKGDRVIVQSSAVPNPVAVRYAWADSPEANLRDKDGLPAVPFRTDSWNDHVLPTPAP